MALQALLPIEHEAFLLVVDRHIEVREMMMMLLAGMVIDRFSYTPVFIAVGLLPVLSLTALFVLVGTIRAIPLDEILRRRKAA